VYLFFLVLGSRNLQGCEPDVNGLGPDMPCNIAWWQATGKGKCQARDLLCTRDSKSQLPHWLPPTWAIVIPDQHLVGAEAGASLMSGNPLKRRGYLQGNRFGLLFYNAGAQLWPASITPATTALLPECER